MRKHKEKDIEADLFAHPELLTVSRWLARQLWVHSGKVDLLGMYGETIVIVEVKADKSASDGLLQLLRYEKDVLEALHEIGLYSPDIRLVLVTSGFIETQDILNAQTVEVDLLHYDNGVLTRRELVGSQLHGGNAADHIRTALESGKPYYNPANLVAANPPTGGVKGQE